ncbi:TetR/AcrR family transcriptional regulator [Microbulbifer sp. SAOS-129_SWC]|uniref:TetR/AcrR family transcriptional regulator n=1 Tax=Microbulbifer sp. SAOS-129_SWC TaxID=3145235 RepID=UPI003216D239
MSSAIKGAAGKRAGNIDTESLSAAERAARSVGSAGAATEQLMAALVAEGVLTAPQAPRGRLLNAAARLFEQKGFARTTVRDIASEVGILSGSIFHHFSSKEDILRNVMVEVIHFAHARMVSAVARASSPREQLRACILCELEAIHGLAVPGFSMLVVEWRSLSDASQKQVLKLRDAYEAYWCQVLAAAGRRGADAALLRRLLVGALIHTHSWFKPRGRGLSIAQLADETLQLFAAAE